MLTSAQLTKLAQEITGKDKPEEAFGEALKSYLEQRMKEYQEVVKRLEQKYGMSFEAFSTKLGQELSLSWEHEQEFMAWEEAVTNLRYFQEAIEQLRAHA